MKVIYIDSEPASLHGGGIRTYIRTAMKACGRYGLETAVYSHSPAAYAGFEAQDIGRTPLGNPLLRKLLYSLFYHENVLLEHGRWLSGQLEKNQQSGMLFEFCDFHGYAYFALRSKTLSERCIVRVHTPDFLVRKYPGGVLGKCRHRLIRHMELRCLASSSNVTAPSAAFVQERLPWLTHYDYLPNPLPEIKALCPPIRQPGMPLRILFIGRVEKRKGVLVLLDALHRLLKKNGVVSLTLAGEWSDSAYCRSARRMVKNIQQHYPGSVCIAGEVSKKDLNSLLTQHDCCVIPSPWENSPYAFFEPFTAGLLCIGADTGEMGRVLNRINSLTFPPGDAGALCKVLTQLLRSPEKFNDMRARQKSFTEEMREQYEENLIVYYHHIIKRKP